MKFKKYFLQLSLFLLPIISWSQNAYEYMGLVMLNDSTTITYKISITEKNGSVKGYSLTDLGGEHETRSNILGEYDHVNNELNFRETSIIYTKSPVTQDDFCFINTTFKKFSFEKSNKIKANFVGLFSDNTRCIDGQLFLNSVEKIEARMDKMVTKINKSNKIADSTKVKINALRLMDSLNLNILKKDQTLSVFSKSKKVSIRVYDGGKEDGDKITIYANKKVVLNNYEANKEKRIIYLNLFDDKTSIVIKAENEGKITPNTVIVEIEDGNNNIKALSNLKQGETTQIDFLKAQ
ncbi:hypothetical protein V8G56_09685 [Gaetbulibacter aquiaggeris]|uniref:Uncharacterized protein n=1 Tax=Gaetbulibacter aquiaggeris TaxID=1735373 RepID=A0ABW7MQA2_9FLAO